MRQRLVVIAIGLVALVLLGTALYPHAPPKNKPFRFVQCPRCGWEATYAPTLADAPCPKCPRAGPGFGVKLVGIYEKGAHLFTNRDRLVCFVALGLVDVLFVTWFVITHRRRKKVETAEPDCRCWCPSCGRKLRYLVSQGGTSGRCPTCKHEFVFPLGAEPSLAT